MFSPIMGRYEEPNMGHPVLGRQYLVNYSFWVMYYYGWFKGKNGTPKDEDSY
jgi:hypothetical protein